MRKKDSMHYGMATLLMSVPIGCAIALLSQSLSPRQVISLGVFGAVFMFAAALITGLHKAPIWIGTPIRVVAIAVMCSLIMGIFCYEAWPARNQIVKVTFKDSPIFTEERKERITETLDDYQRYLVGLGYELPKELPLIEAYSGDGIITAGGVANAPYYYSDMRFPEASIDNQDIIRAVYSRFIFNRLFDFAPNSPSNSPEREEFLHSAYIFACYYAASMNGQVICTEPAPEKWTTALLDVRKRYGAPYTDQLLFFTYKTWEDFPAKKGATFDSMLYQKLQTAESILGSPQNKRDGIRQILAKDGLVT